MAQTLELVATYERLDCCTCGTPMLANPQFWRKRREDGETFFCVYGHPNVFRETEVDKLKKQLDQAQQASLRHLMEADQERAERQRMERDAKRAEKRANAALCPHCNRSFVALKRHLACKHPESVEQHKPFVKTKARK